MQHKLDIILQGIHLLISFKTNKHIEVLQSLDNNYVLTEFNKKFLTNIISKLCCNYYSEYIGNIKCTLTLNPDKYNIYSEYIDDNITFNKLIEQLSLHQEDQCLLLYIDVNQFDNNDFCYICRYFSIGYKYIESSYISDYNLDNILKIYYKNSIKTYKYIQYIILDNKIYYDYTHFLNKAYIEKNDIKYAAFNNIPIIQINNINTSKEELLLTYNSMCDLNTIWYLDQHILVNNIISLLY